MAQQIGQSDSFLEIVLPSFETDPNRRRLMREKDWPVALDSMLRQDLYGFATGWSKLDDPAQFIVLVGKLALCILQELDGRTWRLSSAQLSLHTLLCV